MEREGGGGGWCSPPPSLRRRRELLRDPPFFGPVADVLPVIPLGVALVRADHIDDEALWDGEVPLTRRRPVDPRPVVVRVDDHHFGRLRPGSRRWAVRCRCRRRYHARWRRWPLRRRGGVGRR